MEATLKAVLSKLMVAEESLLFMVHTLGENSKVFSIVQKEVLCMSFMCSKAFHLYIYIAVKTFAGGRAISAFKRISKTENMKKTLLTRVVFTHQK